MNIHIVSYLDNTCGEDGVSQAFVRRDKALLHVGAMIKEVLGAYFEHYFREDWKGPHQEWYREVTTLLARDNIDGALDRFNDCDHNELYWIQLNELEVVE